MKIGNLREIQIYKNFIFNNKEQLCLQTWNHNWQESKKFLKRAEVVISKLRRLEEASATADRDAFAKAARRLYPSRSDT